jgi:hypothetical protein
MNEYTLRRKLMERHDMTWDEAEDHLRDLAEDEYDREQDRKAEEYFNDDKS